MNRQDVRVAALRKLQTSGNKAVANSIAQDKPVLVDVTEYITAKITGQGAGIYSVTKSGNNVAVGIQSFNSNKLDSGEHIVIDSIKGGYALELGADNKTVSNADYTDAAPASLMNSDVIIMQSSKEVMRFPFSEIHNPNPSEKNDDNFRVVGHMPILEAEKPFDIQLEFADGAALPAEDHFIRIEFRAHKLKK